MHSLQKNKRVEPSYAFIPDNVMEHHKYVMVVADVLFVSGMLFFITLSCDIQFVTVQFVPSRTALMLANALKDLIDIQSSTQPPRMNILVRLKEKSIN